MAPFNYVTALSELDSVTSGHVVAAWIWLIALVQNSKVLSFTNKETINKKFVRRIRIFFPHHYFVCLVLHPQLAGIGLSGAGKRKTRDFLLLVGNRILGPDETTMRTLLTQYQCYLNKEYPFLPGTSWDFLTCSPRDFWQDFEDNACELTTVALAIIGFCPHAAPCERVWSTEAAIHTKSRNRMKLENKASIMRIKHHHQGKKRREKANSVVQVSKNSQNFFMKASLSPLNSSKVPLLLMMMFMMPTMILIAIMRNRGRRTKQ